MELLVALGVFVVAVIIWPRRDAILARLAAPAAQHGRPPWSGMERLLILPLLALAVAVLLLRGPWVSLVMVVLPVTAAVLIFRATGAGRRDGSGPRVLRTSAMPYLLAVLGALAVGGVATGVAYLVNSLRPSGR